MVSTSVPRLPSTTPSITPCTGKPPNPAVGFREVIGVTVAFTGRMRPLCSTSRVDSFRFCPLGWYQPWCPHPQMIASASCDMARASSSWPRPGNVHSACGANHPVERTWNDAVRSQGVKKTHKQHRKHISTPEQTVTCRHPSKGYKCSSRLQWRQRSWAASPSGMMLHRPDGSDRIILRPRRTPLRDSASDHCLVSPRPVDSSSSAEKGNKIPLKPPLQLSPSWTTKLKAFRP